MSMFCYQCEQTAQGKGCTAHGVCGKSPDVAALQDLLIEIAKGVGQYAHRARQLGAVDRELDVFALEALFATVTNVNFDAEALVAQIRRGAALRQKAADLYAAASRKAGQPVEKLAGPAALAIAGDQNALIRLGESVTVERRLSALGSDVAGLQELVLYGLKGLAAYADHALVLGQESQDVFAHVQQTLSFLADNPQDVNALVGQALKVGEVNLTVMALLDSANTGHYGHPEPTKARVTPVKGKCILVTGHDLKDLEILLEQTAGKGVNVYTHGEMLPALAYPSLKKYPHLVGNFGGAWQDQRKEFDQFPGAILFTTNCLQMPKDSYKARTFTTGLVGWPGVVHVANKDFKPVIDAALAAPGFTEDAPEQYITIGFAHHTVLSVADKVVGAVKAGQIRHFFLVGGCDGARPGRNYFTELAQAIPQDCVILTLACGKYRFNKLEFGDIGGIPRLLDMGQCNDAYSAIQVAVALSKAFNCGVNDLPLSLILSWYEQKAVVILLTLLHLGIKNIRLGPTLPAFVGPNVLQVLVSQFGLKPTGTVEGDLKAILG